MKGKKEIRPRIALSMAFYRALMVTSEELANHLVRGNERVSIKVLRVGKPLPVPEKWEGVLRRKARTQSMNHRKEVM